MKINARLVGLLIVAGALGLAGCSSEDDPEGPGESGGSAGENNGGGSTNTGGTSNTGGAPNTGGKANDPADCDGSSFHCPGCERRCVDEHSARYCDDSVFGGFLFCGTMLCIDGYCGCTSDENCKGASDNNWARCKCSDGTTVQKTINEMGFCDPETSQCPSYDSPEATCANVCKDNGGSGALLEVNFEM